VKCAAVDAAARVGAVDVGAGELPSCGGEPAALRVGVSSASGVCASCASRVYVSRAYGASFRAVADDASGVCDVFERGGDGYDVWRACARGAWAAGAVDADDGELPSCGGEPAALRVGVSSASGVCASCASRVYV
jgi:hypothetical protein